MHTTTPDTATGTATRYLAPGWVTRNVANPMMSLITRAGWSVRGSRVLHVRGRRTGDWQRVPVNPLTLDGVQYLVAPRGTTQWVRNIRVAGGGRLQLGRRLADITVTEIDDVDVKAPILQAYLRIWRAEVGAFFEGVDAESLDALREIAAGYPVFEVQPA